MPQKAPKTSRSTASAMSFRTLAHGARTIERQADFARTAWKDGEHEATKIYVEQLVADAKVLVIQAQDLLESLKGM